MRIGFDAKRAFHNFSGLGNYSRNLINQLVTLYPENEYFLYNPKPGNVIPDFPPAGVEVHQPENLLSRKLPSLWRSLQLPGVLNRDHLDVFHGLSNELPFNVKKFSGKKVVSIHDLIFLKYPRLYNTADRLIYNYKFRQSAESADKVIAVSEQTKWDIADIFGTDPSKIEVIYQDCAPVFYEQEATGEFKKNIRNKYHLPEDYILYVGTIEERKNLLSILKAINQFRIELPLVVAGKPTPYKKQVVRYISEQRLTNISFIDYIVQGDLPEIYKNAGLFIYPSSYEGFGIPILEALNSGTPVITSRGSCLEETGAKSAFRFRHANGRNPLQTI